MAMALLPAYAVSVLSDEVAFQIVFQMSREGSE